MSSDSHFEAPANSNRKRDRLKRLLKYTIPCLSNNAVTSPLTDTTLAHGTSTDNSRPASLHPLVATGTSTADILPSSHDSHSEPGI